MAVGQGYGADSPSGLTIRRSGDYLQSISTKSGRIAALLSQEPIEILEGQLNQGRRIILTPSPLGTEVYYLLGGQLQAEYDAQLVLQEGDYLIADNLSDTHIFTALTPVKFLLVTTHPVFAESQTKLADLQRLAIEVEVKDGYTAAHCERIRELAFKVGKELGLSQERLRILSQAAYLHDVGKVHIPPEVLLKPGTLTKDEWQLVLEHPLAGKAMLGTSFLKSAGDIVAQHHERFDGSGYPHSLRRDEVMTEAYIIGVVDTYDAMTTDRPYKEALPQDRAITELCALKDKAFPEEVVEAFLRVLKRNA
jgi:HD-GYP domain-containing protein (c-di-GMP phosphodiesterase class II)